MAKYIKKMEDSDIFSVKEENFVYSEKSVQGAKTANFKNALLIESPKRFKLFTEEVHFVKILKSADGAHFKYSRGELPFKEGDCFEVNGVGEYELNGDGIYLVIKE